MEKPLVSICIPTYNRCVQLKQAVDAIICQPEFQKEWVEVIISDNASSDRTEEVGRKYAEQHKNIFYYRNPENIRDRNYPLALSRANGILRKLNNDTFILQKDALRFLCSAAVKYQKDRPVIFLGNGKARDQEKEMNFHDFVVGEGFRVTWIGSFTVWGEECKDIDRDVDGCELLLWQVRKLYAMAYQKNRIIDYNRKLGRSVMPPKKNISYGLYQVFYVNYMELLSPYMKKKVFDSEDIETIERDLLFGFFAEWILKQEQNRENLLYSETEDLKELVFKHYEKKTYWKKYLNYYKRRKVLMCMERAIRKLIGNKNE